MIQRIHWRIWLGFVFISLCLLDGSESKSICENKGGSSRPIQAVGMLKNSLLVVTEPIGTSMTQYVYEMPVSSLNSSMERLYISVEPMTLKDKWPALYASPLYGNATFGNHVYNAFMSMDSQSEYFFITTQLHKSHQPGVVYDIVNKKALKGFYYRGAEKQVLISSNQLNQYFAIHKDDTGALSIKRYRFTGATIKASLLLHDVIKKDKSEFHPLCQVGNYSLMMTDKKGNATCKPLNWPLTKGFQSDEKVYLFGANNIFIFPRSFYDNPNKAVNYSTIKFADFIQCSAEVHEKKDKAGLSVGVIIGIVLGVLIVLLCLALFCTREVQKRRKRHKKHKNKKEEEPAPGGSIFSFFSARSGADEMAGPGKLSAYSGKPSLRSANRSIRSAGVSHGPGQLSGHGNSAAISAAATGRSGMSTAAGNSAAFSGAATGRSGMSTGANSKAHGASAMPFSAQQTARSSLSKVKGTSHK